jgi:rare lipoprotein A
VNRPAHFKNSPAQSNLRARCQPLPFLRVAIVSAIALLVAGGCAHRATVVRQPSPAPLPSSGAPSAQPSGQPSPSSGPPSAAERQPAIAGAYTEEGVASWYGNPFDGRRTSNGEIYDMHLFTAAHRTLPFGALIRVTNLSNGMQTEVRINDRGPFVANRVIDLSLSAARAIGMVGPGTAHVRLEMISGPNPQLGFFAVQVGAFTVAANADKLRAQLSARYSPVNVVLFTSLDGTFYRVRVGHVPTEDAAEQLAIQLKAEQLTTFVVRLDD